MDLSFGKLERAARKKGQRLAQTLPVKIEQSGEKRARIFARRRKTFHDRMLLLRRRDEDRFGRANAIRHEMIDPGTKQIFRFPSRQALAEQTAGEKIVHAEAELEATDGKLQLLRRCTVLRVLPNDFGEKKCVGR